jgi:hypothetical protein
MSKSDSKKLELDINKFDPRILEKKRRSGHSPMICFIGNRGVGKTSLVIDILSYMKSIPAMVCMSGTEDGNSTYGKYIHPLCIYNKFEKDVVNNLISNQKKLAVKVMKETGKELKYVPEKAIGLLIDDLAYDKKMLKEESMREIFMNGRHYNILTMITFQYMMDMPPVFRTNIDYVFVCKENRRDNIERLHKYFFGIFDNIADFRKVLNQCTNDYNCLVLDCTSRSNKIEDCVFWYKSELNHSYKIAPAMWPIWSKQQKNGVDDDDYKEYKEYKNPKSSDLIVKKKGQKVIGDDDYD